MDQQRSLRGLERRHERGDLGQSVGLGMNRQLDPLDAESRGSRAGIVVPRERDLVGRLQRDDPLNAPCGHRLETDLHRPTREIQISKREDVVELVSDRRLGDAHGVDRDTQRGQGGRPFDGLGSRAHDSCGARRAAVTGIVVGCLAWGRLRNRAPRFPSRLRSAPAQRDKEADSANDTDRCAECRATRTVEALSDEADGLQSARHVGWP